MGLAAKLGSTVVAVSVVKPPTARPDLIVMGTQGMSGFKSLIIDSVAQKVISYAKLSVVVMK